jgi:hypothetical protein
MLQKKSSHWQHGKEKNIVSREITATFNNITVTLTEAQFIVLYYEQETELIPIEALSGIDTEKFLQDCIAEDPDRFKDSEYYGLDDCDGITPEIIEQYGQTWESLGQYCKAEGEKRVREVEEKKYSARPRGVDSARIIQVIETTSLRGNGTDEDKCRLVKQYWDFEGNMLAESDPCKKEKE